MDSSQLTEFHDVPVSGVQFHLGAKLRGKSLNGIADRSNGRWLRFVIDAEIFILEFSGHVAGSRLGAVALRDAEFDVTINGAIFWTFQCLSHRK